MNKINKDQDNENETFRSSFRSLHDRDSLSESKTLCGDDHRSSKNRCHQLTMFTANKMKNTGRLCIDYLNNISHIKDRNTTYFMHMLEAIELGSGMLIGGVALFIHSLFPVLFTSTGSDMIKKLYERVAKNHRMLLSSSRKDDVIFPVKRNHHC